MSDLSVPTLPARAVYVYEAPVRLWHWINATTIVALAVTGYLIGSPLPSVTGEASEHYLMGTVRFIHFAAAYIFAIAFMVRVYWAIVGNGYARELFIVPVWRAEWWDDLKKSVRWYLLLDDKDVPHAGHNPAAQLAMFGLFVVGAIFMILTGFALYSEGLGRGSWADLLFGWVIACMGQSQDVHTWHHLAMWWILVFVVMHVYIAFREDVMSRQSSVSTMISGWRTFRD